MTAVDAPEEITDRPKSLKEIFKEWNEYLEGDTPEKIEWFKRGIARRRKELFSMDREGQDEL